MRIAYITTAEITQYRPVYMKKYPLRIFTNSKRCTIKKEVEKDQATIIRSTNIINHLGTTLVKSKNFLIKYASRGFKVKVALIR